MVGKGRIAAAVTAFLVAFTAAGCGTGFLGTDWSLDDVEPTLPEESMENLVQVDLAAVERINPSVLWQRDYEGTLGARLGPRGDYAVVYGALGDGLGFNLLDAGGSLLWSFRYPIGAGLRTVRADVSGDPPVVSAVAGDGASDSLVTVFDVEGHQQWRRRGTGSVSLVMSGNAQRFALLEPVAGRLLLLDAEGRELGQFPISPDAVAAFYQHGENVMLINDADHLRLVSQSGEVLLEQKIGREFQRSVVLSPGGDRVAVTTSGSDSTAYVFDTEGRLLWSKPLFVGGTNQPAFSPDGSTLYVYDVGDGAGVYGLDAATGAVTLRLFPAVPEDRRAVVRRMWTSKNAVMIDYVTAPQAAGDGGAAGEEHVLLVASPDAAWVRRLPLGRNVEVDFSDDGHRLLVVQRSAASDSPATTIITVYDLEPVITSTP